MSVAHVINYELLNVPEAYVHRVGRTRSASTCRTVWLTRSTVVATGVTGTSLGSVRMSPASLAMGHSGGEQQRLPPDRQRPDDLADGLQEAEA